MSWVSVALSVSVGFDLSSSTVWNALTSPWAIDSARMAAVVASIDSVPDWRAGGKSARMPSTPRTMTMSAIRISISVMACSAARVRMGPAVHELLAGIVVDEETPADLAARPVDIQAHRVRLVDHPEDDVADGLGIGPAHDLVEGRRLHLLEAGAEGAVARRGDGEPVRRVLEGDVLGEIDVAVGDERIRVGRRGILVPVVDPVGIVGIVAVDLHPPVLALRREHDEMVAMGLGRLLFGLGERLRHDHRALPGALAAEEHR